MEAYKRALSCLVFFLRFKIKIIIIVFLLEIGGGRRGGGRGGGGEETEASSPAHHPALSSLIPQSRGILAKSLVYVGFDLVLDQTKHSCDLL